MKKCNNITILAAVVLIIVGCMIFFKKSQDKQHLLLSVDYPDMRAAPVSEEDFNFLMQIAQQAKNAQNTTAANNATHALTKAHETNIWLMENTGSAFIKRFEFSSVCNEIRIYNGGRGNIGTNLNYTNYMSLSDDLAKKLRALRDKYLHEIHNNDAATRAIEIKIAPKATP